MLDLTAPLAEAHFTVVDIETTGLKPPFARITEIAAVQVRAGEVGLRFAQLVNPGCRIPREIVAMTGITDAMVAGQPAIDEIWGVLRDFWDDSLLVAHNAKFDLGFLDCDAARITREPLINPEVCTVKLSRRLWPRLPRHNLDTVAGHLGLDFRARHRALGDAEVTAALLLKSLPLLEGQGVRTVGDLLHLQRSGRVRDRLRRLGLSA